MGGEAILMVGLRLSIHHFSHFVLRSYGLALTQLNPNSWSQVVGSWMLLKEASYRVKMPFSIFQTFYIPKVAVRGGKIRGWYYLTSWKGPPELD